ncbi:MAG TPA: PAS domain S-box protein, partial [Candidatus Acidoferrales bacterium]|nr:PAS domain S-box protein [Candidatus Acidoferrales bacterium]
MNVEKPDWLEQMEGILETLNEGVLIADDCQRVLFLNERMERLLGLPRAAVVGKTAESIYKGVDYEFLQKQSARGREQGHNRFEFFVPRPDGSRVSVIVSARDVEDPDGRLFAVVTFTDITEQKRAEQSLRDANVQLERRAEE